MARDKSQVRRQDKAEIRVFGKIHKRHCLGDKKQENGGYQKEIPRRGCFDNRRHSIYRRKRKNRGGIFPHFQRAVRKQQANNNIIRPAAAVHTNA